MAAMGGGARRALLGFRASSRSFLAENFKSSTSSSTSTSARFFLRRRPSAISRLPVELGCAQSLMPLHSVTASALLTSMLSLKPGSWAWLSEGFATPL